MSSQRLTIWRHSQKSYRMPHMKNIYTPKKKMFKTTATFCEVEVAVGCWVLSLSTTYREFSATVSSAAPKKCAWVDSTSKTQGFGVGDRSRKMVLSRSSGAWSRFAHHCLKPLYPMLRYFSHPVPFFDLYLWLTTLAEGQKYGQFLFDTLLRDEVSCSCSYTSFGQLRSVT